MDESRPAYRPNTNIRFFCLYQFGRHQKALKSHASSHSNFGISPFAEHGIFRWSVVCLAGVVPSLPDSKMIHFFRLHNRRHNLD